ncbi:hypothetical protein ES703_99542 [subsurface metagenome]
MNKINPWLEERIPIAEPRGSTLRYIVEVEPGTREAVVRQLGPIPDLNVISRPANNYIVIYGPSVVLPHVEAIPEVIKVSADTLVYIKSPLPFLGLPTPAETFRPPSQFDPYVGLIHLSEIEIPVGPAPALIRSLARPLTLNKMHIYTTVTQRDFIGAPKDNKIGIKCAVADTGVGVVPHLLHPNTHIEPHSTVPGELPWDGQGHGTWCITCAFGDDARHPKWGKCDGISDPSSVVSIKCLSNMGFGMTSWVLEAISQAHKRGARVLSMSLGGPLQGSAIDDDPECRLINELRDEMIVVVAAGNDGIEWSVGSPGASPHALTVGAWSMTDDGLSWFSSRGPSGEFYREHPDVWGKDFAVVRNDLIKPDVCCPGGGRVNSEDLDEQILSGCSGWFDPYGDPVPGFAVMKGTSMATPACAGLIALAVDRGIIETAADIKGIMSKYQAKNSDIGYGLLTWPRLMNLE